MKRHPNIGQVGFFQACEALRTHRETIEKTCHTREEVLAFLITKTGLPIPLSTLPNIAKATGIPMAFKRKKSGGSTKSQSFTDKRILIRSITRLYDELGVEVSTELADLYQRSMGAPYVKLENTCLPESNGILVSKMPDSRTLPVTSK